MKKSDTVIKMPISKNTFLISITIIALIIVIIITNIKINEKNTENNGIFIEDKVLTQEEISKEYIKGINTKDKYTTMEEIGKGPIDDIWKITKFLLPVLIILFIFKIAKAVSRM